jgi:hypothetical protein
MDLLATLTLKIFTFHAYTSFPALLPFFKWILTVLFFEDVQHRLRFCLDHLSYVKMAAFQFYLQSGKQKSRVGGGWQLILFLVKNSLVKKEM